MSITLFIIGISVIVSLMAFSRRELFYRFEFNPYVTYHNKQWYRIFSHALIHGDYMHLFVNMFVLWNFGPKVEQYFFVLFGAKGLFYYALLYIGGVGFATLPSLQKHRDNPGYNAVGASGAVAAVLFSSIIFTPMAKLRLLFIPFSFPAWAFGIFYITYEIYAAKNSRDNIAHDAHYIGAIFGVLFTIAVEPKLFLNFINNFI